MYDDVVRQGVPDRFVDLIRKLDGQAATPEEAVAGQPNGHNEGRD
jgi:hypothetical protein